MILRAVCGTHQSFVACGYKAGLAAPVILAVLKIVMGFAMGGGSTTAVRRSCLWKQAGLCDDQRLHFPRSVLGSIPGEQLLPPTTVTVLPR